MTQPDPGLAPTRATLHAVAELVLAGPQHRASNTIRLCVSPGGFRTVKEPDVRVVGGEVFAGDASCPMPGATARSIGTALGLDAGGPVDVYHDGSNAALDDELSWDDDAAARIVAAYELGDAALRMFAPDEQPVLWPEHFDVAIRVDEVNYGVSPGDGHVPVPYAYVGVDPVPDDPYWNAPFGRTRPVKEFRDVADLRDFFAEGRERLSDH
jgi:hypothetical protein